MMNQPDDSHPRNPDQSGFPIAAVGASAGGLAALRELLKALPGDSRLALVLVLHQDPDHLSRLADILGNDCGLPVAEAGDGLILEPGHVYVSQPGTRLGFAAGLLRVTRRRRSKRPPMPIDDCMTALAKAVGERAVGVLLSGTGSDGTRGLKAIARRSGTTLAQDPETAEFPQMPAHAIAAGAVATVRPLPELAAALADCSPRPGLPELDPRLAEELLARIFPLLREHSGTDFSRYKLSTLKRRLEKRLQQLGYEDPWGYLNLLRDSADEREALFNEFLIRVTAFFRDPEAFETLGKIVFPELIEARDPGRPLRLWVPACASGEEVYTLAICLKEAAGVRLRPADVQIFGSDIDPVMIEGARAGVYSAAAAESLPEELRERYFSLGPRGFRIHKQLREMCSFAVHNLTRDPPFSQMDLICCRNLLIYLQPETQEQILGLFHFGLNPDGVLMLGSAESLGRQAHLFRPLHKGWRVYRKQPYRGSLEYCFPRPGQGRAHPAPANARARDRIPQLAERLLLNRYAPPGVIIDGNLDILHFHGHTGHYLDPQPGAASLNLLAIARPELATDLRIAFHKARKESAVCRQHSRLDIDGNAYEVILDVIPLQEGGMDGDWYLVLFDRQGPVARPHGPEPAGADEDSSDVVAALEAEIRGLRNDLQAAIEIHDSTTEELTAANEEIRSANEELQSSNEELESSQEELQSSNEELSTVNDELHNRNLELKQSNTDLVNLLDSSGIAVVLLDEELRIRIFNTLASRLLGLGEADRGRHIMSVHTPFEGLDLGALGRRVLEHHDVRTGEFRDAGGATYMLSVRPYRSLEQQVRGCVLVFYDISRRLQAEFRARRLASVVEHSEDAVLVYRPDGEILEWSPGAEKIYGWSAAEAIGMNTLEHVPEDQHEQVRRRLLDLLAGTVYPALQVQRRTRDGRLLDIDLSIACHTDERGESLITTIERDVTAQKQAESELRKLNTAVEHSPVMVFICDPQEHIVYANPRLPEVTGYSREELLGQTPRLLQSGLTPPSIYEQMWRTIGAGGTWRGELCNKKKNGDFYWVQLVITPVQDEHGHISHYIGFEEDITQNRRMLEKISYQATHDALTGLVNRAEFERRLERLLSSVARAGAAGEAEHALCYLDLDQFKVINDTCGHVAGDELLRQLAACLHHEVRQRDTLARFGGDEFAIALEHCTLEQARRLAESLRISVEDFAFAWEGRSYRVGISIGLVAIDGSVSGKTELLQQADAACYMAKEKGRNRVYVFQEQDRELAERHGQIQWVARIQEALEEDRLVLYAQPIKPIPPTESRGEHIELLVRMRDPGDGLILPGAFLPAAERYNLSTRIDCWVIETAFGLLQRYPAYLERLAECCINLSGSSIADSGFQAYLETVLDESGIEPAKICFEITETAAIANLAEASKFIAAQRARGCRFSLDDFGTGLSSFAYLKSLPVDYLKIDGLFVKDIVSDSIDFATVRSINDIGRLMGKQTIAEYVEDDAILDKLREIGVQYAQGYGIGEARPFRELLEAPTGN